MQKINTYENTIKNSGATYQTIYRELYEFMNNVTVCGSTYKLDQYGYDVDTMVKEELNNNG